MNAQIREEAAEWLVEFRTDAPDATAREQFATWLRTSPEHVRAYLESVALWEDAGLYDSTRVLDVDALIQLAQADYNVVGLDRSLSAEQETSTAGSMRSSPVPAKRRWNRRSVGIGIAAVVAALATATGVWFAQAREPTFATEIGEQRSIRLVDGSSVELNALSRIRIRFSAQERDVDLLAGQALFRVFKDNVRPFVVHSHGALVRAVGTQFDVRQSDDGVVVTVIEGRVAVLASNGAGELSAGNPGQVSPVAPAVEVVAGQQTTVRRKAVATPQRANTGSVTAWTKQLLIFEATPLSAVVEDFNRFNPRSIVIQSPELADFHVSGTFSAVDPASLTHFLNFLRAQPGIRVVEADDRIVVTRIVVDQK